MLQMELACDRIGKLAQIAAMTTLQEEAFLKEHIAELAPNFRLAITFVAGYSSEIRKRFVKSVIACAIENGIVYKDATAIHGLMHAALEAFESIGANVPAEASLKMKVAIVTDDKWIAVAIYGDSAISPVTNHERSAMGVMHL